MGSKHPIERIRELDEYFLGMLARGFVPAPAQIEEYRKLKGGRVHIEVYHEDEGGHVATVEIARTNDTTALEFAWRWTNNVEGSWSQGPYIDGVANGDHHPAVLREVRTAIIDGRRQVRNR